MGHSVDFDHHSNPLLGRKTLSKYLAPEILLQCAYAYGRGKAPTRCQQVNLVLDRCLQGFGGCGSPSARPQAELARGYTKSSGTAGWNLPQADMSALRH